MAFEALFGNLRGRRPSISHLFFSLRNGAAAAAAAAEAAAALDRRLHLKSALHCQRLRAELAPVQLLVIHSLG